MTRTANTVDAARVELLLTELRLPGVKAIWPKLAAQSDKEGWPAARFLAALAEHEAADRARRRIERHMAEARLPAGKTLATFDFDSVPMVSKAQVMALASGDVWLKTGANLLLFGPRPCGAWLRHDAAARAICRRRSGSHSSRTAGVCSSHAPPISCSGCRWPGASWRSRPPSPSSTATTS
jgi:DNA replication protein DnaC